MKYIIGILCIIIAILMWFKLDIFADTQTIFGTIFFLLGNLFINFERGKE